MNSRSLTCDIDVIVFSTIEVLLVFLARLIILFTTRFANLGS